MKTIVQQGNFEISFTDEDVIGLEDIHFEGDFNPHRARLWLLHDQGFTICVVEADCLQDALDAAVDADKLDRYLINVENESERSDYMTRDIGEIAAGFQCERPEYVDEDGNNWWWSGEPSFLGNASEPFDIESLGVIELPLPQRSLTRLYGETLRVYN